MPQTPAQGVAAPAKRRKAAAGSASSDPATLARQEFVDARGRASLFLFLDDILSRRHVLSVQQCLDDKHFTEIDLVVHSGGGDINSAYQIIELARLHSDHVNACVPLYAKSAATLLCIGSNQLVLGELAELGPLDTQVWEETRGGRGDYRSALNPFKALDQLQDYSLETLDKAVKMLVVRSGLDVDQCLQHSIEFVRATTGPLISQLNADKLGEYNRALSIGEEYGKRLLQRHLGWDKAAAAKVMAKLVYGYPSHDYIIDHAELEELGLDVRLFSAEEQRAANGLIPQLIASTHVVECLEPSAVALAEPVAQAKE